MKNILFLVIIFTLAISCREQVEKEEKMIPVEADGGIGDGAPSLDSLLQNEKDSLQTKPKDTL
ncbi:hypothetical protein [Rasiella sp. SM2506]|uniref:hypothetical protein n=1 Tax=Rasiella sp. SM2506 TaxID=3423914 RepID=UPI003D7B1E15